MSVDYFTTTVRAGVLAIGVTALAIPALAQTSPAGTGGGAGGESGSSTAQRAQQRNMPEAVRPRFANTWFNSGDRPTRTQGSWW